MRVTFVDVFTSEKFRGNNAAVCFVDREPDAAWMQALAAELAQPEAVRTVQPDLDAIERLPISGVVVTARGEKQFDFISRFFCPAHGFGEDPVTGSAHASLAPFWAERLGKRTFVAYQTSARGGVVHVRLEGDRGVIGGAAVTRLRGELS